MTTTRTIVTTNMAQCLLCNDVIESVHRHDYKSCSCGNLSVDGGTAYLRRTLREADKYLDLSITREEEIE